MERSDIVRESLVIVVRIVVHAPHSNQTKIAIHVLVVYIVVSSNTFLDMTKISYKQAHGSN
jgi:hypothetical protein